MGRKEMASLEALSCPYKGVHLRVSQGSWGGASLCDNEGDLSGSTKHRCFPVLFKTSNARKPLEQDIQIVGTEEPKFLVFSFVDCVCACAKLLQSCPTLWDPMDCSPPGSSVHGLLQARILEWVAMPSSRGHSQPRNRTWVSCSSCITGRFFTTVPLRKPL